MSIFGYFRRRARLGGGISIIIPFRCPDRTNQRVKNVEWVQKYWAKQLPGAEIIIGEDPCWQLPFSKSVAINNAAAQASGDVFVIVDGDGYVSSESVLHCAKEIRKAQKRNKRLWFVPYRQFYRLTEAASQLLLSSSPAHPVKFTTPPHPDHTQGDADPHVGHWYGAMIQIMPREAFEIVGGWDPRFRGWGGEDHAAMRAMDTLYSHHKTLPGAVLHIWHPQIGPKGVDKWVHWKERMWENQTDPGANDRLSWRYYHATGNPKLMRKLVDEGLRSDPCPEEKHHHKHHHHHRHHRPSC